MGSRQACLIADIEKVTDTLYLNSNEFSGTFAYCKMPIAYCCSTSWCSHAFLARSSSLVSTMSGSGTQQSTGQTAAH